MSWQFALQILGVIITAVCAGGIQVRIERYREQRRNGSKEQAPVLNGGLTILQNTLTQLRLKDEEIALLREQIAEYRRRENPPPPAPRRTTRRRPRTDD